MVKHLEKQIVPFLVDLANRRHLAKNTVDAYQNDLLQYAGFLLNEVACSEWTEVSEWMIRKYIVWMKDRGSSSATIARRVSAVRRFHRYLVEEGECRDDPAYAIRLPKIQSAQVQLLTYAQVERLLAAPDLSRPAGRRDRAILELLYATGIHVSELIRLNLGDVNLHLNVIRCPGKSRERIIPFGDQAEQALFRYIEERKSSRIKKEDQFPAALFVNRRGGRLSRQSLWKLLKYYGGLAGIDRPLSPEILRQSLAVHLLKNGADLQSVEFLMGRTSPLIAPFNPDRPKPLLTDFYHRFHPRA